MIECIPVEHSSTSKVNQAIGTHPSPSENANSDSSVDFPEFTFPSPDKEPAPPPAPATRSRTANVSGRQFTECKAIKHMRTRASKHLATLCATSSSESEVEVVEGSVLGLMKTNHTKGSHCNRKGKGRAVSESVENNRGGS